MSTSTVQPLRSGEQHEQAVARLLDSYRAVPPSATVRLAKRTSNLFRPRGRVDAPGLDVSGSTACIAVDAEAPAPPTCRACAPTSTSSTPPCRTA